MALCLMPSITGCASAYVAAEFIPCQHPTVDASTQGGLVRGLLDYADAVDTCNTLNGVPHGAGNSADPSGGKARAD